MKTSELSLSAFLMMLLTLVARCRVQLNPVINPFSPFYCPPLITPTLNYTHNLTARPACGVIHASVHLCCSIYSSQCLLCSYISIESFWKATKNKLQLFGTQRSKRVLPHPYYLSWSQLLFCGMGSSFKLKKSGRGVFGCELPLCFCCLWGAKYWLVLSDCICVFLWDAKSGLGCVSLMPDQQISHKQQKFQPDQINMGLPFQDVGIWKENYLFWKSWNEP